MKDKMNREEIIKILQDKVGLSEREMDVFFEVGSGVTNMEAAISLSITEGTVKFHLTNVFRKLEIKSRVKLVLMANGVHEI